MTITEKALSDLLLKYFTTLEPVGRDVTLKNEMKRVPQPDGSTKVQMVPTKGDAYLPKELANALSKSISKAVVEQVTAPVVDKLNELIGEYNQLRVDFVAGGGVTTSLAVDEIP